LALELDALNTVNTTPVPLELVLEPLGWELLRAKESELQPLESAQEPLESAQEPLGLVLEPKESVLERKLVPEPWAMGLVPPTGLVQEPWALGVVLEPSGLVLEPLESAPWALQQNLVLSSYHKLFQPKQPGL